MVAMRDGERAAPRTSTGPPTGRRCPRCCSARRTTRRSPRSRTTPFDVMRAVQAGYACVVQDTRGRYSPRGSSSPFFDEADRRRRHRRVGRARSRGVTGNVGHGRRLLRRRHAMARGDAAPPAPDGDRPVRHRGRLPRGLGLPGRRLRTGVQRCNWTLTFLAMGELVRRLGAGQEADFLGLVAAVDDDGRAVRAAAARPTCRLRRRARALLSPLAARTPTTTTTGGSIASKERCERSTRPDARTSAAGTTSSCGGTIANYVGDGAHGATEAARRPRLIVGPWAHGDDYGAFAGAASAFLAARRTDPTGSTSAGSTVT